MNSKKIRAVGVGLVIPLCLLFVSGCNQRTDLSNSIPSRIPDIITDSGVIVYIESDMGDKMRPASRSRQNIQDSWDATQECLGMYSDTPPVAIVVDDVQEWLAKNGVFRKKENLIGYAAFDSNLVIIKDSEFYFWRLWKHEFIHILLHQNGTSDDLNSDHKPDYLWHCQHYSPAPDPD